MEPLLKGRAPLLALYYPRAVYEKGTQKDYLMQEPAILAQGTLCLHQGVFLSMVVYDCYLSRLIVGSLLPIVYRRSLREVLVEPREGLEREPDNHRLPCFLPWSLSLGC